MVNRILLVEAPQIWRTKDHTPPLGLGYLATAARDALPGAEVTILDASAEELSVDATTARIAEVRPDVIGLTANSHNRFNVIDLCAAAKSSCPSARVVLGGPHFSYTADDALRRIATAKHAHAPLQGLFEQLDRSGVEILGERWDDHDVV